MSLPPAAEGRGSISALRLSKKSSSFRSKATSFGRDNEATRIHHAAWRELDEIHRASARGMRFNPLRLWPL